MADPDTNDLKTEPGPWGGQFIMALEEAGIVPRWTQRVVIEATLDSWVRIYAELHHKDGAKVQKVIVTSPAVAAAEIEVLGDD